MLSVAVVLLLSQAPLPPGHPAMPPGHPVVPDSQPSGELPPGHPAVPAVAPPAGQLPANHPAVREGQTAPSGEDLLKKLEAVGDLKSKEKTFEIAASLGKLYFVHGKYADAVTFLEQGVIKAEPARALYLAKKKALGNRPVPTAAAAGCPATAESTLEGQLARAQTQKDVASHYTHGS